MTFANGTKDEKGLSYFAKKLKKLEAICVNICKKPMDEAGWHAGVVGGGETAKGLGNLKPICNPVSSPKGLEEDLAVKATDQRRAWQNRLPFPGAHTPLQTPSPGCFSPP